MTGFKFLLGVSLSVLAIGRADAQTTSATVPAAAPSADQPQSVDPAAAGPGRTTEAGRDPEIVVTARRRTERLIDVPVAVTALTASALERSDLKDLTSISTRVPNLIVSRTATGSGASLTIRGIGSTFTDSGIEQTVSLNIDGLQGARGFVTSVAFLDLAQVEVLKGPQALFFGKNSPAGVVSLTSNDPTSSLFASAKAGYEFVADQVYVEGVFSGPITPTLGARLAFRVDDMKGFYRNNARATPNPFEPTQPMPGAASKRSPDANSLTARATLKWEPSSDFTANLKVLGNRYRDQGLTRLFQPLSCAGGRTRPTTSAGAVRAEDPFGDCNADGNISSGDLPVEWTVGFPGTRNGQLFSDVDSLVGTLNLGYRAGPFQLVSITGYSKSKVESLGNQDSTVYARVASLITEDTDLFTQEFRASSEFDGPINFVVGAYYEKADRTATIASRGAATPVPDLVTGNTYSYRRDAFFDTQAESVFGQLIWDIAPTLELAGGARYTHERKITTELNTYVAANLRTSLLPQGQVLRNVFSGDNISPEVTLTWHPRRNLTAYAAYKTGYKSGGATVASTLTNVATSENIGFGPEKAVGGELGFKGDVLGGRTTFSLTGYSYKFEGLQLSSAVFIQATGLYTAFIRNAASARSKGVEAEVTYRFDRDFSINGSASYNSARLLSFPNAICYSGQTAALGCSTINTQDRSGQALSRAPEWVLSAGFNFETPVSEDIGLNVLSSARYSSFYATQDDGLPAARQGSYATIDATIRLHAANDRWEIALVGKNLTNQYYILTTNTKSGGLPGEIHGTVSRPRELGVQLGYRF